MKSVKVKAIGKNKDRCSLYVYISLQQRRKLEKIAASKCKSLSSFIRDVLDSYQDS